MIASKLINNGFSSSKLKLQNNLKQGSSGGSSLLLGAFSRSQFHSMANQCRRDKRVMMNIVSRSVRQFTAQAKQKGRQYIKANS